MMSAAPHAAAPHVVAAPRATAPSPIATAVLGRWQSDMLTFGQSLANYLAANRGGPNDDPQSPALGYIYYDANEVFRQIARYTRNTAWLTAANDAEFVYLRYVNSTLPGGGANNDAHEPGGIPGRLVYTNGLRDDYVTTGNAAAYQAIKYLTTNSEYAQPAGDLRDPGFPLPDANQARETGLLIQALVDAKKVGLGLPDRLAQVVNYGLGDIDQMFGSPGHPRTATYVKPFYVGILAEGLIQYQAQTGDPRVLPELMKAADGLWNTLWVPSAQSFLYSDVQASPTDGAPVPAPDLNLLVAPLYGWLYHMTGNARYMSEGDQIFAGGVNQAYLADGKHFDQNYLYSFDYVGWRQAPPVTVPPPTGTLHGTVFNDLNGQGIAGATIYLDLNNSGAFNASIGDPKVVTDVNGNFSFAGLPAGNYIIRQLVPAGAHQTFPVGGAGIHITLGTGQTLYGLDFDEEGLAR